MSTASSLIADFQDGSPDQILSSQYSWPGLSLCEREEIFSYVQAGDAQARNLLRLIARMALTGPYCDPWDEARILSLGIQYMGWNYSRQQLAFDQLVQVLDRIEQNIPTDATDEQAKLLHYRAEYFELFARYLADTDQLAKAIKIFSQASDLYRRCGKRKLEQRVKQQIRVYEEIQHNRGHIIPTNEIDLERMRLQKELDELNNQSRLKASDFERLTKDLQELQERRQLLSMELQEERDRAEQEIRQIREQNLAEVEQAHQELEIVTAKLNENKILIQFFLTLSTLTTGPLWLEVVKLALDQGEMDHLGLQALQRLIAHFPEQSTTLIAEVFARLPEIPSHDLLAYSTLMNSWVMKLQQAEQIYQSDKIAAARLIVAAWEEFCYAG